jgi:hypothetical protein
MSRRLLPWTIALRTYCSLFSLFVVSEFALGYVTERSIPQVSLASLPDCLARLFLDSFFWWFAKRQGRLRIVVFPDAIDALFECVVAAWQSLTRE